MFADVFMSQKLNIRCTSVKAVLAEYQKYIYYRDKKSP